MKSRKKLFLLTLIISLLFTLTACSEVIRYKDDEGCQVIKIKKKFLFWTIDKKVQRICPDIENPDKPDLDDDDKIDKEYDGEITLPENKGNPNAGLNGQLEIDSWKFETNSE